MPLPHLPKSGCMYMAGWLRSPGAARPLYTADGAGSVCSQAASAHCTTWGPERRARAPEESTGQGGGCTRGMHRPRLGASPVSWAATFRGERHARQGRGAAQDKAGPACSSGRRYRFSGAPGVAAAAFAPLRLPLLLLLLLLAPSGLRPPLEVWMGRGGGGARQNMGGRGLGAAPAQPPHQALCPFVCVCAAPP
jgi:hypothetical protein